MPSYKYSKPFYRVRGRVCVGTDRRRAVLTLPFPLDLGVADVEVILAWDTSVTPSTLQEAGTRKNGGDVGETAPGLRLSHATLCLRAGLVLYTLLSLSVP